MLEAAREVDQGDQGGTPSRQRGGKRGHPVPGPLQVEPMTGSPAPGRSSDKVTRFVPTQRVGPVTGLPLLSYTEPAKGFLLFPGQGEPPPAGPLTGLGDSVTCRYIFELV